jgi:septal ring factor EnvC (AmiA/AmiB activator)
MTKNNQKYCIVFLLVWVMLLPFTCFVFGQNTKAGLDNEKKLLEKEIKEQKRLLEITKNNKTASLREIQLITNQIQKQENLIRVINDELLLLDCEIEKNTKELSELKQKLNVFTQEYRKAVYAAYKYRNVTNKTGFILSSESLTQAATRVNYLQKYSRFLNQQLIAILQTQEDINKKNTVLQQNKVEKTQLFNKQNIEKENLAKQQTEKNKIVANLKKHESQINNEIEKKVNRRKQIDAAIKKIIDEEIAVREKKNATTSKKPATNTNTTATATTPAPKNTVLNLTTEEANYALDFESNKGKLPWPVEKGKIITQFGTYSHPEVSSVMIENRGIDILTEKNAPIQAIFQGIVSRVIDMEGSKIVLIRHGNYITVYSDLTNVKVKQNDKITAKQVIGYVKSNVSDANAEIHFEIWKDRTALNPSLWIKQ